MAFCKEIEMNTFQFNSAKTTAAKMHPREYDNFPRDILDVH